MHYIPYNAAFLLLVNKHYQMYTHCQLHATYLWNQTDIDRKLDAVTVWKKCVRREVCGTSEYCNRMTAACPCLHALCLPHLVSIHCLQPSVGQSENTYQRSNNMNRKLSHSDQRIYRTHFNYLTNFPVEFTDLLLVHEVFSSHNNKSIRLRTGHTLHLPFVPDNAVSAKINNFPSNQSNNKKKVS